MMIEMNYSSVKSVNALLSLQNQNTILTSKDRQMGGRQIFKLTFSEIVVIFFMSVAILLGLYSIAALNGCTSSHLFADLDEEDRDSMGTQTHLCFVCISNFLSGWFGPEDAITMNRILDTINLF